MHILYSFTQKHFISSIHAWFFCLFDYFFVFIDSFNLFLM
ncbi:hypothetical protein CLOBOL_07022 [Enterocloster bolteae ATCC BAA-613]|uniref:Uncharacterized protein n=1 Tax=Enterocloster bolteae (strain ATCC BAA-613 / DSM 15670 / CCUG 46953 / JCM 12243 / WAL 16351) TaxID=411902 RepID=A8S4M1_ENTBW|nr:hypothetical protein CLOBOL_07022 [Enterocloster bolteae ATCC BAA-613]